MQHLKQVTKRSTRCISRPAPPPNCSNTSAGHLRACACRCLGCAQLSIVPLADLLRTGWVTLASTICSCGPVARTQQHTGWQWVQRFMSMPSFCSLGACCATFASRFSWLQGVMLLAAAALELAGNSTP